MTFSIVACDPAEQSWGVAVASKFLAVSAMVSWAEAGAGAIATQAYGRMSFGPNGLALLREGQSAADTLAALLATDPRRESRQVGVVDRDGGVAAHTGSDCYSWAGHRLGDGFACQGNILVSAYVLDAMADTFKSGTGELADRLLAALSAGDGAGGDRRGRQGAGILVVRANSSYSGDTDRYLDLRVDDDPLPVHRLSHLVSLHHLYFRPPTPEERQPITESIARELQAMLRAGGYTQAEPTGVWDTESKAAFAELVGTENLEVRWQPDNAANGDALDTMALNYLRAQPHLRP